MRFVGGHEFVVTHFSGHFAEKDASPFDAANALGIRTGQLL